MTFQTDQQTLNDLGLLRQAQSASVFDLYDHTRTRGGGLLLEAIFAGPLTDERQINQRSAIIQYFAKLEEQFPFDPELLDRAESYMAMNDQRTMLSYEDNGVRRRLTQLLSADGDYEVIVQGVQAICQIVRLFEAFLTKERVATKTPYEDVIQQILALLQSDGFSEIAKLSGTKISHKKLVDLDKRLRFKDRKRIQLLLGHVYELDVFITLARVAVEHRFSFPQALPKDRDCLSVSDLRHPLLAGAKGNDLSLNRDANVVVLTGANMAGKSTLMKSLGVAFYVAHLGLPVAAEHMEFSVCDGLYTTINLSDDINSGFSHFYAEVLRLKTIAKELSGRKKLLVIFDELFRGTNVKDACDGTVAVTGAFASKKNGFFMVSTHIVEAAEELKRRGQGIQYLYMPTSMEGSTPRYTYTLANGITADRHGMVIIGNERILEIIQSRLAGKQVEPERVC